MHIRELTLLASTQGRI